DGDLYLTAAKNIPPRLAQIVEHVTHGKGMAGAAQVERRSVQTCNLQADGGGPILPAAREAGGPGAAAPPLVPRGAGVGVVGITCSFEGEIAGNLLAALESDAAALPAAARPSEL